MIGYHTKCDAFDTSSEICRTSNHLLQSMLGKPRVEQKTHRNGVHIATRHSTTATKRRVWSCNAHAAPGGFAGGAVNRPATRTVGTGTLRTAAGRCGRRGSLCGIRPFTPAMSSGARARQSLSLSAEPPTFFFSVCLRDRAGHNIKNYFASPLICAEACPCGWLHEGHPSASARGSAAACGRAVRGWALKQHIVNPISLISA